jgi:hypothetical protein
MHEGWIWLAALVLIGISLWAVAGEFTRKQKRTVEEYEADVEANKSDVGNALMRAGLLDLEKRLNQKIEKSAAYLEDENSGRTRVRRSEDGED